MSIVEIFDDYQSLPEYSGIVLDSVACISLFGDKPINIAATRGLVSELSVLLENGADPNDPGEHGYRPLHNAVEQGHLMAVHWLLNNGANKALINLHGDTPLDLAKLLEEKEISDLLA